MDCPIYYVFLLKYRLMRLLKLFFEKKEKETRICKNCRLEYIPNDSIASKKGFCSPECRLEYETFFIYDN